MMTSTPIVKTQSEVLTLYKEVRKQTERLCNPLRIEDYVVQPTTDVSPPKWHLAHTSWFFEAFILSKHVEGYKPYHPQYAYLFNSYYEHEGERTQRADRGFMTRPTVDEVYDYRSHVDDAMIQFMESGKASNELLKVIELGLNHEQQHQELLVYDLKYILGHNPLFPIYQDVETPRLESREANWLKVDEDVYEIGFEGEAFHFDNEEERHKAYLRSYEIMDRLITNAEYMEFIQDGGYQDFRHWLMEGWEWVNANSIKAPHYWHFKDGQWQNYTLAGLKPVNPNEPVTHISYYEAEAFASWKGMRLPTEAEWEVACMKHSPEIPEHANLVDSAIYHVLPCGNKNMQFIGDTWEWTQSAYMPYPGYKAAEGALGEYNGKFMVNQMVLRGGSCATPRNHIRPTYRNFFHPHLRWLFSGIRLAK